MTEPTHNDPPDFALRGVIGEPGTDPWQDQCSNCDEFHPPGAGCRSAATNDPLDGLGDDVIAMLDHLRAEAYEYDKRTKARPSLEHTNCWKAAELLVKLADKYQSLARECDEALAEVESTSNELVMRAALVRKLGGELDTLRTENARLKEHLDYEQKLANQLCTQLAEARAALKPLSVTGSGAMWQASVGEGDRRRLVGYAESEPMARAAGIACIAKIAVDERAMREMGEATLRQQLADSQRDKAELYHQYSDSQREVERLRAAAQQQETQLRALADLAGGGR